MATIRKITPSQGISDFRPMRQEGGGGFRALAQAMDTAYDYLLPAAIDEATKKGDALGREISKGQIGDPQAAVTPSSKSGPAVAADPNAVLAGDAMAALGKGDFDWYKYAVGGAAARPDSFSKLNPEYASRVQQLILAADQELGPGALKITSAYRSVELQRELWEKSDKSGKWVAAPGRSKHNSGMAVDFADASGKMLRDPNSPEAQWIKANAPRFGLDVPMSWEPWQVELAGSRGGAAPGPVTASTSGTEAPTVLRGADGKLTSRLFGPTANPIMAAHDAAAGVAYQSDVFLKAGQDFMGMSEQFAMDPDGFKQAADEYVKAMVESAPEPFRMDVRAKLENEASRRFLGLVDEKHANIRQRAANSSAALSEMWADDLASAIASGNPEEIEAARTELGSVLAARERLPGSTWTPEQSANYMRKAEEAGRDAIKKAQDEQVKEWKSGLDTIITASRAGLRAGNEADLDNPLIQQALPELYREALAFTTLRDELPSFNMLPPAEQAAALAEMKAQPVIEEHEVALIGAAESVVAANRKAWEEDPIKRAGEVLPTNPPPVLPEFDPMNPDVFASALASRADYGVWLRDNGFTAEPEFLSNDEAKTIGAMFGKEVPPELKAMAAGMVVSAMGPNAVGFFKEISTSDPVIPHVGGLLAMGGDPAVATEAMLGQSLLDQKVVQAPSAPAVTKGMAPVMEALTATPGAAGAMQGVRDTATAIYAARVPAGADETTQAKFMEEAVQAALGQSLHRGKKLIGGVQEVGGQKVLLPPNMAGEDLTKAMDRAFGDTGGFWSWAPAVAGEPEMWMKSANGIPSLGGEPLDPASWANGEVTMTPMGGTKYMLTIKRGETIQDARVQGTDDLFIFDAEALIEASLAP